MSVEPLQNLLKIYGDKGKVLFHYLPKETIEKVTKYEYISNVDILFLNDRLLFVMKTSGKFYKRGIIIKITDTHIMIKTNVGNISIKKETYYIFRLPRKNKLQQNNRKFYEELLKSLHRIYHKCILMILKIWNVTILNVC